MQKIYKLAAILLFVMGSFSAWAVPAKSRPLVINQPDGTTLTVILKGDEFHKYHITTDGLLIAKNEQGVFEYARGEANGKIVRTGVKANDAAKRTASERSFVSSINRNPDFTQVNRQMRAKRAKVAASRTASPRKFPRTGNPKSLVILVNFSDLNFVTPNPQQAFTKLLNEQGYSENGGTGSARDYFMDNSMNTFKPEFIVVGPYTLPQTMKFYGENDPADGDNDKNAVQMVVDACKVASDAGVDFTQFDVDGDNFVDNVFVYYAGHNEAEGIDENTVWPHRWGIYPNSLYAEGNYSGTVESITFNGKRIEDYACTSELKDGTGKNMCGIGTFTHEFGHVLGLADMYATNGAEHYTLSDWNIMDSGSYLNDGRTPPAYNAFERFQLGYLAPTLVSTKDSIVLNPILSHNQAILVSSTETHNLNAGAPSPSEFFLLENRQNTGWDAYLPGHGMLIYRINYDQNDFDYNVPNNDPAKMGVEIIPADKKASEATMDGDPFPGTKGVTSYRFALRSKELLEKRVSDVTETDGVIHFSIVKPLHAPVVPSNTEAITATEQGFTATWSAVEGAENYKLNIYTKTENTEPTPVFAENFDKFTRGLPNGGSSGVDVSLDLDKFTQVPGWEGEKVYEAGKSIKVGSSSVMGYISLPPLDLSADGGKFTLKFDAMAWSGDATDLKIYLGDDLAHTVAGLGNSAAYTFSSFEIDLTGGSSSTVITFQGTKPSKGRFFLDNLELIQNVGAIKTTVENSPFTVSDVSYAISGLDTEKTYFYSVSAVKGDDISPLSNEVGPIRLVQTGVNTVLFQQLNVSVHNTSILFDAASGETVDVYNAVGQKIHSSKAMEGTNSINLMNKGIFIVKVGNRIAKVSL